MGVAPRGSAFLFFVFFFLSVTIHPRSGLSICLKAFSPGENLLGHKQLHPPPHPPLLHTARPLPQWLLPLIIWTERFYLRLKLSHISVLKYRQQRETLRSKPDSAAHRAALSMVLIQSGGALLRTIEYQLFWTHFNMSLYFLILYAPVKHNINGNENDLKMTPASENWNDLAVIYYCIWRVFILELLKLYILYCWWMKIITFILITHNIYTSHFILLEPKVCMKVYLPACTKASGWQCSSICVIELIIKI